MKLYVKDSEDKSSQFDLGKFMQDQGKTLIGPRGRSGVTNIVANSHDVVYRVKDNDTGEESDFDAQKFMQDQGRTLDVMRNFQEEEEQAESMRKRIRYDEIEKLQNEARNVLTDFSKTEKEKFAESSLQKWFPNTYSRLKKEMSGEVDPSTLKKVGLAAWDALGNITKVGIGAFEAGIDKVTDGDHGRPFSVSTQRVSDYGPDIDEESGNEVTLGKHMDTLKEAMRVDAGGVMMDLAIESGRDPLVTAGFIASTLGGPVGGVIAGSKTAKVIVSLAKKYKTITAPAVAATKFARKVNDKVLESNLVGRGLKSIVGEGVGGGMQGVLYNGLMDSDKNKLNTFIIEGVEESIFGGMMFVGKGGVKTAWSLAFDKLSKEEKKNALLNKAEELKQAKVDLGEDIPLTPEKVFNTINTEAPVEKSLEENIEGMTDAEKLAAQDALTMAALPVTAPVPPGVSRKDMIKKMKDPLHETKAEAAVKIEHDANTRQARKALNDLKNRTEALDEMISTETQKITKQAIDEIKADDAKFDLEQKTRDEDLKKKLEEIQDPTKPTSFETWKSTYGLAFEGDALESSYKEFRKDEESRIAKFKQEIDPAPKPEPVVEPEVAPEPQLLEEPSPVEIDPEIDTEGETDIADVTQDKYVEEKQKPIMAEKETIQKELEALTQQSVDPETVVDPFEIESRQSRLAELEVSPGIQKMNHTSAVQKAVNAGKQLSPEVAKDYPDMKPRSFDISRKEMLKSQIQSKLKPNTVETELKPNTDETQPNEVEKVKKPLQLVDESKLEELKKRIDAKFKPGRLYSNPGFDSELWTDIVQVGMIYTQRGFNSFIEWSDEMVSTLSDKVKPFLRSAYNAINAFPKDREFDADLSVKIFEFGGILKEEGLSDAEIKSELERIFEAGDFSEFVNKGLKFYPTIDEVKELNYVQQRTGTSGSDQGVSDQESGSDSPSGEGAGPEGGSDLGPNDGNVPGISPLDGLEESQIEDEHTKILRDFSVRSNIDLRHRLPVDLTPGARSKINSQSIEILERVKKDPKSLTEADRDILRQYTGQGGLDVTKMEESELVGALNQHYTSYQVARSIWKIVESLGYNIKGVDALEPTAGVGNFAGTGPKGIKWHLNEVDQVSGEIMQILYPESEATVSPFESYVGQQKDLVITNVPFLQNRGKYAAKEEDGRYSSIKNLHDYIIMKSIDQLKDNGLGVFISSTWTMDKKNSEIRRQINQKAEIIAAIRTPMGAYQKNTQYAGSTDIIFMRKRTAGEIQNSSAEERLQPSFVETIPVKVTLKDGTVQETSRSKWFEVNRSQAIGEWSYGASKGGIASTTAIDAKKDQFDAELQRHFEALAIELKDAYVPGLGATLSADMIGVGEDLGKASTNTPKFGLEIKDGKILKSDQYGRLRALRTDAEAKKGIPDTHLKIIVQLMETAKELRDQIAAGADVKYLQDRAAGLLEKYSALPKYNRQPQIKEGKDSKALLPGVTEKIGTVKTDSGKLLRKKIGNQFKHPALKAYAGTDNRYSLLRYLYNKDLTGLGNTLTMAPVTAKAVEPKRGDMKNPTDVKKYIMEKYGVFRTADAKEAWAGDPDLFESAMMSEPDLNRHGNEFMHDNDYLVGNMKDKLEFSKKFNLKKQIEKIMRVLPEQKTAETVDKNPVSTWWSWEALTSFARTKGFLGQGQDVKRLTFGLETKFRVSSGYGNNVTIHDLKDGNNPELADFVNIVLNQKNKKKIDPASDPLKPTFIDDLPETDRIRKSFREQFKTWTGSKNGLKFSEEAAANYNENFATKAIENYSQSNLFIKNVAPVMFGKPFTPFRTQLSAVRMIMSQYGGILAHDVGNGKTLAAIFSFAALRSMGRAKKAIIIAPAGTMGMWESNVNEAIQGSRVKYVRGAPAEERRADLMDAAANDYDVIIISHDAMKTLPLRKSNQYLQEEIAKTRQTAMDLAASKNAKGFAGKAQIKSIEARISKLEARLESNSKKEKDALGNVFYEDLGADMIIIDEAHNHKNVFNHTNEYTDKRFLKMGGSSHMADDMVYKTRYNHEINNRGNVLLLTATPTPNNIIEIYSMIKYVAPWEWEQRGINSIDDFIRNFVEIGPMEQSTLSGTTADKEGVIGFKNGQALNDIVRSWVDYKEATPESQEGLPESIKKEAIIEPNDEQINMLGEISVLDSMKFKDLKKMGINPVTLTTRAKALAVDPAFENPKLIEQYPSFYDRAPKLKQMMDDLASEFKEHPDRNNLIFLQNYNIRDFKPKLNSSGEKIRWPHGFGNIDSDENGMEAPPPSWLKELTPDKIITVERLMKSSPVPSEWDAALLDRKGVPPKMTTDKIESYKPEFDEETGEVYIQEEYIYQDLHQEMKKHAIEVIGMDPDRVMIVNGKINNKPEDKTRLELLSSMGRLSLIIGNSVMSEGLNLQEKGNAVFTADVPWEPKTVTQQNGRVLRSRSDLNDKVPIKLYNYALRYSADRKLYQILERKREWNRELNYGNWDNLDNSINNVESVKLSDELEIAQHIVDGHKTKFEVVQKGLELEAASKFEKIAAKDVEKARKNYSDSMQKIENARAAIEAGMAKQAEAEAKVIEHNKLNPDKIKNLPEPYDPSYHLEIIKRHTPSVESGQKFIDEAISAYEPYAYIAQDREINKLAQALLVDAKQNNWHSIEDQIEKMDNGPEKDARRNTFSEFIVQAFGEIAHKYRRVADMSTAAIVKAPLGSKESYEQVNNKLRKYQGGYSSATNLKVMGAISAAVAAVPILGVPGTILAGATIGSAWGLGYAGLKLWRADGAKVAIGSIRARLSEMPGSELVLPRVNVAVTEKQTINARDEFDYRKTMKGMSPEERLMVPDYIEGLITEAPQNVIDAALKLRSFFQSKALELQKAGIDIPPDPNYFPRMIRWDMMQKMKNDPDLLKKNAIAIVRDPLNQIDNMEDAYAVLMSMFDNTAEARQENRAKQNKEFIESILAKNPNLSYQGLIQAMARMKNKYGLQILGNIKYGRRAPRMVNEMYYRDPHEVMASYIPGVNDSIIEKRILGEGSNNAVNQFLNSNFPISTGDNSQREEVAKWFRAELSGKGLGYGRIISANTSRKLRAFQYWTKLGLPIVSSVYAPAKNLLGVFNMSLPLAGGRSTAMGIMGAMGDATTGFSQARQAGAISNRIIQEVYGDAAGKGDTSFEKLMNFQKEWGTFGISEKFVRSWAFHSGRNLSERLYDNATTKNSVKDKEKLIAMIGNEHFENSVFNGGLTPIALDVAGVFMANKLGGKTSAFDMAAWMTTPEGRVLMQFHSMAYAQTNIFKNEILKPMAKGNFAPFLKYCAAVGISITAMTALSSAVAGLIGDEPPEEEETDNIVKYGWNALMLTNMVFATGMFGDIAAGMDVTPGVVPLVGTMTGPTSSSILNAVKDFGEFIGENSASAADMEMPEDPYKPIRSIINRELPGLNMLRKAGHIPGFEE